VTAARTWNYRDEHWVNWSLGTGDNPRELVVKKQQEKRGSYRYNCEPAISAPPPPGGSGN